MPLSRKPKKPTGYSDSQSANQLIPGIDAETERLLIAERIALGEERSSDRFPALYNTSSALLYRFLPAPKSPPPPEYVYVPVPPRLTAGREAAMRTTEFIASWNYAWEAANARHEMFAGEYPPDLAWLDRYKEQNLCLIANEGQRTRYDSHVVLYHMLPLPILERYGLPLLRRGHWPNSGPDFWADRILPPDADRRLERAVAAFLWPFLSPRSSIDKFSNDDSIKLLAHNLDFWIPYADQVAQARMAMFPRVELKNEKAARLLARARSEAKDELHTPRMGGYVWRGERDAHQAAIELVAAADAHGNLRGIFDAIRSHRVEEDFSPRWSFEREDLERKLYNKRARVRVSFVELDDTIPVHGPASQADEELLWEDFLGLLDAKERHVVVCLKKGLTRLGEIGRLLGYANHSPISKALSRIRRKARTFLQE